MNFMTLHQNQLYIKRQMLVKQLAEIADQIGQIDRNLAIIQSMDLEEDLTLASSKALATAPGD